MQGGCGLGRVPLHSASVQPWFVRTGWFCKHQSQGWTMRVTEKLLSHILRCSKWYQPSKKRKPPPPLWKAEVRLLLIARSRATFWIINDLHARGKSSCSSWAERDWNLAFTQGTLCETGHLKLFLQMAPSRETCKGRRNHQNESRKNNTCLCLQYLESFVSRRKRALRIMVNKQTSSVQQVYLLKLNS